MENDFVSGNNDIITTDIRLRNDGDGVGVVSNASQSWILQPGASCVVQSPERVFQVLHDGLRMLREPEWAELVAALNMTELDTQVEELMELCCQQVVVEQEV